MSYEPKGNFGDEYVTIACRTALVYESERFEGPLEVKIGGSLMMAISKVRRLIAEEISEQHPAFAPVLKMIEEHEHILKENHWDGWQDLMEQECHFMLTEIEPIGNLPWRILVCAYMAIAPARPEEPGVDSEKDIVWKMWDNFLYQEKIQGLWNLYAIAGSLWLSDYPGFREKVLQRYPLEKEEWWTGTTSENTSSQNSTAQNAHTQNTSASNTYTQSESSKKGGCYVATAVYGSYDCPQVWTLRRYRDNTLAATWYGRMFIRLYYVISPSLVRWFGDKVWFKRIWRRKLDDMIKRLREQGVENTPYDDKDW